MADAELVRVLDYILNRSDAATIEAVAAAVVRRKRDLALFGASAASDPRRWAKEAAQSAVEGMSLDGIRNTVRGMVAEMLRKEAPELSDDQLEELMDAWVPDPRATRSDALPESALRLMVDQFVAYSTGVFPRDQDEALRSQLGDWPERYWQAFPAVVRSLVTAVLKGAMGMDEFRSKMEAAIDLSSVDGEED